MSAPLLTWNFEAVSNVTCIALRTDLSRPVDAKLDDLVAELWDYGYRDVRLVSKEWERWAWPGGYPLYYVAQDGGVLCSKCVNDNIDQTGAAESSEADWTIVGADINWEDPHLVCDHCGEFCESAYGESNDKDMESSHDSGSRFDAEALASAGHGTDEDYGSAGDML